MSEEVEVFKHCKSVNATKLMAENAKTEKKLMINKIYKSGSCLYRLVSPYPCSKPCLRRDGISLNLNTMHIMLCLHLFHLSVSLFCQICLSHRQSAGEK